MSNHYVGSKLMRLGVRHRMDYCDFDRFGSNFDLLQLNDQFKDQKFD